MKHANAIELNAVINAGEDIQLEPHERQPCEVWTRVMGYHRPVASFNPGKQSEHAERKFFTEACARHHLGG
jgi:Anaerobic ribonucleoside-triphosphate reductase